jgi:hypothetical protein
MHTPLAEVLAVVAQQAIAVLSQAGTRTTDHLLTIETRRGVRSHKDCVPVREDAQRNLLHRSPAELMCEGCVVHDGAATHVDAMVGKGKTRRNEVRAQRWFFIG